MAKLGMGKFYRVSSEKIYCLLKETKTTKRIIHMEFECESILVVGLGQRKNYFKESQKIKKVKKRNCQS